MKMCRCCGAPATADEHGFSECCGEKLEESVPCEVCGARISPTYACFGMCDDCEEKTLSDFYGEYWSKLTDGQRELLKYRLKDYFQGGDQIER